VVIRVGTTVMVVIRVGTTVTVVIRVGTTVMVVIRVGTTVTVVIRVGTTAAVDGPADPAAADHPDSHGARQPADRRAVRLADPVNSVATTVPGLMTTADRRAPTAAFPTGGCRTAGCPTAGPTTVARRTGVTVHRPRRGCRSVPTNRACRTSSTPGVCRVG
jgi:hypothetical protein